MNFTTPTAHHEMNLEWRLHLWTLDNPVFCCYLFWASILVLKMLFMSPLTGLQRFRNKVFSNPEDLFLKDSEVQFNNPHVERVRRAHRNDMENILPFFTMALIYIATDPNPTTAFWLFRIAAVARIVHTLVYAFRPVPQPSRVIAFAITILITAYMGFYVAVKCAKYI